MSEQNQNGTKKGLIALIVILLAAVATLGYLLSTKNTTVNSLEDEKSQLIFDLEEAKENLASLETSNDSMDIYIESERARLNNLIDSVSSINKASSAQLKSLRNQVYAYRKNIKKLEFQVDSIQKAYDRLSLDHAIVKDSLNVEMGKNEALTSENRDLQNEVAVGARLSISRIEAGAFKVRSSGEESETKRASRADRVKACFTLAQNNISKKGERTVYMRITTPDLKVMVVNDSTGQKTFDLNGQPLLFSAQKAVWYENESVEVCMAMDKSTEFSKGTYTVEIYTEGYIIGTAKFTLD